MGHRIVRLPEGADETKIKARYDSGILEVTVPMRWALRTVHLTPVEEQTGRAIPIAKAS